MCKMLENNGQLGMGVEYCGGCHYLATAQVMETAGGFYVGVADDGGPFCRITPYMSEADAHRELESDTYRLARERARVRLIKREG